MFQGFCKETIDFMWGIRFNNERAWFEAHKTEYQTYFYGPMRELAETVFGGFTQAHSDLDLINRVSRIYRDARRLHGRGPYKDRLWFTMERPVEVWSNQPVFWFELEPEGYSYGLGYYAAPAVTMAKFRKRLDDRPAAFETLARAFQAQDAFLLEGEDYKRSKGECTPLLAPWYNKKGFSLTCTRSHDALLFSPALADQICEGYDFLLPYYQYLLALEGDPDPRI